MALKIKDFSGKRVYITGGSSGIGLECARLLAGEGAHVFICARDRERIEQALPQIEACRRNQGQDVQGQSVDVADHVRVTEVLAQAVADFGVPDILINAAGRAYPHYFQDISYAMLDETMKTNFYGVWNMCATLVPHMQARGGYIVNVSSMVGFMGVFGYCDYAASKFAVVGFSGALRSELKRFSIGVSVLCPPDTDTPGFAVENRTKPQETVAVSEGGGLMQPRAVAQALLKGMARGQAMIVPGAGGKAANIMQRLFPGVVEWVMDRQIRKVQGGQP